MTVASRIPEKAARRLTLSSAIPVRPLVCSDKELTPCPIVGYARSKSEAVRLVREAGWRILHVGGLLEVCPTGPDDAEEWSVTVHPPKEPLTWYDETGRRTIYDIAAQRGRL